MNKYGFIKVASASPTQKVADTDFNTNNIIEQIQEAEKLGVYAIVFPELSITSYTAQDLFLQSTLIKEAEKSLDRIRQSTTDLSIVVIVGLPVIVNSNLYNVAAVVHKGDIEGLVPKTFLPNYNEFYDKRWFSPANDLRETHMYLCDRYVSIGTNLLFKTSDFIFGVEICEDLWTAIPPSSLHSLNGADIIFNLSASPEVVGKNNYRKDLVKQQSARCIAGYVYSLAGNGESTTDLVFSGGCLIAENGSILAESERFSFDSQMCIADVDVDKLRNERLTNKSFSTSEYKFLEPVKYEVINICTQSKNKIKSAGIFHKTKATEVKEEYVLNRYINPTPFIPSLDKMDEACSEIFSIQIGGLGKRLLHTNIKNSVIGISGGLDSTLALLVLVATYDKLNIPRSHIYGITMPGFGTTGRTYNNAVSLMKSLGVTMVEISIKDAVLQHFKDIDHDVNNHDVTYENSQARERTQILMDYANKVNGLVIGTGDLSELALGWCTYNGDQMSMYGVNSSVPKTLVKVLVRWIADNRVDNDSKTILVDVLETPVSPELLPAGKEGQILQITEDTVGPYILHDFFLYNALRCKFEPQKIYYLAKIAFEEQFSDEIILKWLKTFYWRFFSQQFKRSCMPDGPKVGSVSLSPRGDWRMPSDASVSMWLKQLDTIQ